MLRWKILGICRFKPSGYLAPHPKRSAKKMKTPAILLATLFWCLIPSAKAHNNYFLPGDAFFSASITRDVIREWMRNDGSEFEFHYSRFDGQFMACGNIGYTKLKIAGIDDRFRAALSEAYWRYTDNERPLFRLENDDPKELSQVNGIVALIYNSDFSGPLGLKLNEDWQTQGAGRYGGLFKTAEPVVADWKLGPKFPPLKIDQALDPRRHLHKGGVAHRTMDVQLTASAKDLKIVLVGFASQEGYAVFQTCPNLQRIYDYEDRTEYVVVDPKGLTTFSCNENGLWKEERIDTPVSDRDSQIPKAEQDGADQPATAPESKPDGDSKPQPKSEVRSQ